MGTTVLDPQVSVAQNNYVYAQCLERKPGGVTLLVINTDRQRSFDLNLPTAGERYALTAKHSKTPPLSSMENHFGSRAAGICLS
jgi:hypothetical protein